MLPTLYQRGDFSLSSYTVVLAFAFVVGGLVRARESRRLGYVARAGYRWVAVGALAGAVLGSKLGMLLYVAPAAWGSVLDDTLRLETSGKTVIGALIGGYGGVELSKRLAGVQGSTGDAFAVAVPLSLAIGRIGCFLAGCCYGAPWSGAWSVHMAGADRHPVQLYEAGLDLLLAALVWRWRDVSGRAGDLFKLSLVGYGVIRIALDPLRGDPRVWLGPLSAVQAVCLLAIALLACALWRRPGAIDARA